METLDAEQINHLYDYGVLPERKKSSERCESEYHNEKR
ncbi:hypothetical protein bmyco0002_690 [Bacillus pseudomycoides]|nr:hypothetical protein bmyco0002_690 [Bacillus pseudomycoides]